MNSFAVVLGGFIFEEDCQFEAGTELPRNHARAPPRTAAYAAMAPLPSRKRGLLALLGLGLITGASDDDPSGIATYSQAGAPFGYSSAVHWTRLAKAPMRF